jgi:hypothetical protein
MWLTDHRRETAVAARRRQALSYRGRQTDHRPDIGIDYHTVASELVRQGTYERAGGMVCLSEINLATPSAAHIEHYAQIVADHHVRQRTIAIRQTNAEVAWRAAVPVEDMLAMARGDPRSVRSRLACARHACQAWHAYCRPRKTAALPRTNLSTGPLEYSHALVSRLQHPGQATRDVH